MIQKHDASFDAIVVVAVKVKIKLYSRYQIKQWEYFHVNFHFAIMLQIINLRYEQSLKLSLIIMALVGVGDTIHPDPPHSQKILPSPRYNSDIEYHSKNSMITETE